MTKAATSPQNEVASEPLRRVTAVLSMAHEPAGANSATRRFRSLPVLQWTLRRLARAKRVMSLAVVCWDDQLEAVKPIADEEKALVLVKGPRVVIPQVESVAASRRWADGWRGGLLSTCDFDAGFYAPWALEVLEKTDADAVLLVDPASALVDPLLVDDQIAHASDRPAVELCFAPAAPGLAGAVLRPPLLRPLAAARTHAGRLLHYQPDGIGGDPLAQESCAPVPTAVARATVRLTMNSDRQVERLTGATVDLNGQLFASDSEQIVRTVRLWDRPDAIPRELVLETTTRRSTRPIFWPGQIEGVQRPDMSLGTARLLIEQLGSLDDTRLTFAGVGDPLLWPHLFDALEAASRAGVATHVETDLFDVPSDMVARLARSSADVVSVHIPAVTGQTYVTVMGVDAYRQVLENVKLFVTERLAAGRGVPLIVPLFTKCRQNLAEMEAWYDQWLRAVGSAVIVGPTDYAGLMVDPGVADMSPPRRRPCSRLWSRLTVLSDGRIVSCEQDVLGRQTLGTVGKDALDTIWREVAGKLRDEHASGNFSARPACAACREWHRP